MKRWWCALSLLCLPAAAMAADEARTLFDHGLLRRAAAACEQRLAADPRDAGAGALLSRIRAEQGDLDAAEKLAMAAVAAAPRDPGTQYALAEVCGRKAQAAGVLRAAGLAGRMRKAAEAALAADPRYPEALEILVDFHRLAPGIMGGDRKKSAEYLERLAAADPVAGWLKRAQNALRDKDTTLADECYRKAAAIEPPNGRAQVALASWLAPRWRDPAAAEKLALAVSQREPWRTGAWQVLAALCAVQQRWSDLETVLKQSEAAEPAHLMPYFQAGRQLAIDHHDPARAEACLRKYLAREPEIGASTHAAARWRLGQALEQQGRKAEAVAELQAAVKLDPRLDGAKQDLKRLRG